MTIFDTLLREHELFRSMYGRLFMENTKGKIFEDFTRQLDMHMEGEEQVLYPRTKETGLTELTLESIEEHHIAKLLLHELENMSGREKNWHAKLQAFIESIEHHFREEEEKLFPAAEDKTTRGVQEEMDDLYWDLKSTVEVHKITIS